MAGLQEYKCPCCGGAIAFDSKIQKMKCPYCDTEFEMDALKGYDAELQNEQTDDMEWDTSAGSEWQEGETDGLRTYVCKSCGGEIVGDANMAATSCPFCDNPIIMMGQFAGALKPDLVIPFKLDKKAAKEGLKKHLTGKRLLPKIFKDQNHIDEIKGVYVPFWLFDTNVDANISAATKSRTALLNIISLLPVSPLCKEPIIAMAPTQNNRLPVTKPSAIALSLPVLLFIFRSTQNPILCNFSSKSIPAPIKVPTTMDTISIREFSPLRDPLIPR